MVLRILKSCSMQILVECMALVLFCSIAWLHTACHICTICMTTYKWMYKTTKREKKEEKKLLDVLGGLTNASYLLQEREGLLKTFFPFVL